jgi:hypothetical protein
MNVRHEINEQEMIDIFDQFAGSIIDGYPCEELTEYLHETVRELAVDQTAVISKGDFTYILEDFIGSFVFDDENGGYIFEYEDTCLDMYFQGETRVINTERSKAYRDMWKVVYNIARAESFRNKYGHDTSTIYLLKYILKAANTKVNGHAIDLGDVIKMVELAIESTQPEVAEKPPTQSVLRRFELEQHAKILAKETEMVTAFGELLLKSKRAASPQQSWKLFYRAQRVGKTWKHHAYWLVNSELHLVDHAYISEMKKCVTNIIYPKWIISKIGTRLCQLKLKSNNPLVLYTGDVADLIDDEIPF